MRERWIIYKTGTHWTVGKRDQRSYIHGLPYKPWFRTRTGAEALAVFHNPRLRSEIGW